MTNYLSGVSVLCLVWGFLLGPGVASAQGEGTSLGAPTWRFVQGNDLLLDSDNKFTNGFNLQKHSAIFDNIDDLPGLGGLTRGLLPEREGLLYRSGWAAGQNMVTPTDLLDPNIILDDVPYLGLLAWSTSRIAFNDREFTGFEILLGVVGEASGAEQAQTFVHELIDSDEPMGWDHQLSNEPIVNFYYMKKRKLWRKPHFDGAVSLGVAVGNFVTLVDVGLEMRFGDMPGGFAYIPDPLGRNMSYDATIDDGDGRYFYGTLALRATGFAHAMFFDGNVLADDDQWTEQHTIESEDGIGSIVLGVSYIRPTWGIHFNFWFTTDTHVPGTTVAGAEDTTNDFGTIMYEWRY